jgi:hypothetical protein
MQRTFSTLLGRRRMRRRKRRRRRRRRRRIRRRRRGLRLGRSVIRTENIRNAYNILN